MSSSKKWVVGVLGFVVAALSFLTFFEPPKPVIAIDPNLYLPTQDGELAVGYPDASHELRIYFAPTCAHCAEYHRDVMPILVERFITRGVVRIVPLLFVRHAVDMYLTKIFMCRGHNNMYPAFLMWLSQLDDWVPIFIELDMGRKIANLKKLLNKASEKTKVPEIEIINALKINVEDPDYRHYVAMYALLNGYRLEEIVMSLDNDKLEKEILSMKLKAVDNESKQVQLIPAAYWDGQYIEGVPGAEEIDALLLKSHKKSKKKKKVDSEAKQDTLKPDQPIQKVSAG